MQLDNFHLTGGRFTAKGVVEREKRDEELKCNRDAFTRRGGVEPREGGKLTRGSTTRGRMEDEASAWETGRGAGRDCKTGNQGGRQARKGEQEG